MQDQTKQLNNCEEKCYSCGGKGTYSQMHGVHGAEDFGGDGFDIKPSIHNYPCKSCNGTGLKQKHEGEEKCKNCQIIQNGSIIRVDNDGNCIFCKRRVNGEVSLPPQDKRCKPCQLENNLGTCDRNDCSNHSQDNGDWEDEVKRTFSSHGRLANISTHILIGYIQGLLLSQRQSNKELILGKMEEKKKGCEFDSTEGVCANCLSVDTCKSIVEEVLHD